MWRFWIDTGGTFTDCLAEGPDGGIRRAKILSSSCLRASAVSKISRRSIAVKGVAGFCEGFFVGYRFRVYGNSVLEYEIVGWDAAGSVASLDRDLENVEAGALCEFASHEEPPVFVARVVTMTLLSEPLPRMEMRLATTRGTNALLERKGAKLAFLVSKGFGDLLRIGNQQRPNLFELGIQKQEPLPALVIEVEERLDSRGKVLRKLGEENLREQIRSAIAAGVESFSIALLHSYLNPIHERRVEAILREEGAIYVSVSSELSPFVKLLPRAETTVVDGYLAPIMDSYLDAVEGAICVGPKFGPDRSAGDDQTDASSLCQGQAVLRGDQPSLRVMTSAGGLVGRARYRAKDSLLSGPAGGVVGSSRSGLQVGFERTIAFDMGGTSTDVSRFDGELDYRFEQRIGAARVFAPSLRIETVAAGGGSICWFDGSALRVGPHSAGANPGPACYGAGGPLALTDINLLLGRLDASKFGIPVSENAARARLEEMQRTIFAATNEEISESALLKGFLDIANETMAEAIRKVSTSEGYDPSEYALVAFGGAGGLHACSIAEILGMDTIVFPSDAGLLSAYGLRHAQVEQFSGRQVLRTLDDCSEELEQLVEGVGLEAMQKLALEGGADSEVELQPIRFEMRFRGQESTLVLEGGDVTMLKQRFTAMYEDQFGFLPQGLDVELVAIRAVARSAGETIEGERFEGSGDIQSIGEAVFLDRMSLVGGSCVAGPVVIQDSYSTVFVDTGWKALVCEKGTMRLERYGSGERSHRPASKVVDLELFTNRFLSIVDEMGVLLERVAFSTNVKDRKDFSCALLDRDGYLVANAPHIPVHLGALGVCLREVLKSMKLGPGDVVVTNHPRFGGSHLPDVTLLAPVYSKNGESLLGYVANRAHHAELGGVAPGSMPPNAKNLFEEGVVIAPTKLVQGGVVDWGPILELFKEGRYPSRSVDENVADLSAQLASVRLGVSALQALAETEGGARTVGYMGSLKARAAKALSDALEKMTGVTVGEHGSEQATEASLERPQFEASERLDDGAAVCVQIQRQCSGKWLIDFEGSAGVQANNYNATPAVVTSAVIYVLRLLAKAEIPLNEGFLDVVDIRIPDGMLNPVFGEDAELCPAVVAGNVEVSQLVVSTLIKAFGIAACSQSTMNNLIFGTKDFGYYETIAGGEGATADSDGASGVHTHMTNTAMTDPEIMELRYPVRVEAFALRSGSGGRGRNRGGEGVRKRLRFLDPVTLSLLTQRRENPPFGMDGGEAGACGEQVRISESGRELRLVGNGTWEIAANETVEIRTPGGGGWGSDPAGTEK